MRSARTESAIERAGRIWGDAALDTRRAARAKGKPVSRWLDDQAGRRRGDAVVSGIARLSYEMVMAGDTPQQAALRISDAAMKIVLASVQRDGPQAA